MTKKNNQKIDIQTYCRNAGIILIVLGVLHFLLPQVLDKSWGVPLIAVGLFALIFRKRSTLLVFGISLVLVGILNFLPLLLYRTEVRWAILGGLQIYWGTLEFFKFYRLRGKVIENKIKPIFQIIGYIILTIIFLFYIYGYITSYSLYKTVDGKEVLVDFRDCKEPYKEISYRCCIPSENYSYLCEDEALDYEYKLNKVEEATIKKKIVDSELGLSFESPEGYSLIEDTKEGGISLLYEFSTYGIDEEGNDTGDFVYISIYDYRSISTEDYFWQDILDSLYLDYDESDIKEEKTSYGYDIIIIETTGKLDDDKDIRLWYKKDVFFKDKEIEITFYSTDGLKWKIEDFDDLVDSIEMENN